MTANCLLATSLLLFPLNTGSCPHKREHLPKTLMSPMHRAYGPVTFHHTWIKYRFHRGALESGPRWPLCAIHSLPLPELLQPRSRLQILKAEPSRLHSGGGLCFSFVPVPSPITVPRTSSLFAQVCFDCVCVHLL